MLQVHLHGLLVLLKIQTHEASAATAVAVDIDEAGGEILAAAVDVLFRIGCIAAAVAQDFSAVFQQPALFQQPVGQYKGRIGE